MYQHPTMYELSSLERTARLRNSAASDARFLASAEHRPSLFARLFGITRRERTVTATPATLDLQPAAGRDLTSQGAPPTLYLAWLAESWW